MVPDSYNKKYNNKSKYYYKRLNKRKKGINQENSIEPNDFGFYSDSQNKCDSYLDSKEEYDKYLLNYAKKNSKKNTSANFIHQENSIEPNSGFYSDLQNNYDNYLFQYANQCNYYEPLYNWTPQYGATACSPYSLSTQPLTPFMDVNYNYFGPPFNYWNNQFSTINNNSINDNNLKNQEIDDFAPPHLAEPKTLQNLQNVTLPNEVIERSKPTIKHIKHIVISAPTNLKSLIDIINNNEISDNVEYNIDVKSLKYIKSELTKLRDMVGMEKMKESVFQQLLYFIQNLHIGNDKNSSDFKHTVIMGPPGTGKTHVAKIIGNMYAKLGVLKKNIFKKVTRNDLIAGYLGQTAIKTQKVIEECLGGVLFIDEAYSLANEDRDDSFSKECLDTLCEALSDHKDDLMVIIAGYENELNNRFFNANKGLDSRFIWRFKIDEYTASELMRIFLVIVTQSGWEMLDNKINERWFQEKKDKFQGLGRDMEVLFTYSKMAHSLRIYGKDIEIRKKISLEDMDKGYKIFLDNLKKDEQPSFINSIYI